jgi:hypothetical protein
MTGGGCGYLARRMIPILAVFASAPLGKGRSVHIATLARETIIHSGAEHLGFNGYFVFEANDLPGETGIEVLGKASSFEAAIRLTEIWQLGHQPR